MMPRSRRSTSDASGSFFVAAVLVDLSKKVLKLQVKHRFADLHCSVHFPYFSLVRAVFGEILECARATLASLCAPWTALVVARRENQLFLGGPAKESKEIL